MQEKTNVHLLSSDSPPSEVRKTPLLAVAPASTTSPGSSPPLDSQPAKLVPAKFITDRMSFYLCLLKWYATFWVVGYHAFNIPDSKVWQIFIPRFFATNGDMAVAVFFGVSGFLNGQSLLRDSETVPTFGKFVLSRVRRMYKRWAQLQLSVLLMTTVTLPLFSLIFGGKPSTYVKDALTPGYWLLYLIPVWHPWQEYSLLRTDQLYVWFNYALVQLEFLTCILEIALYPWLHRRLQGVETDQQKKRVVTVVITGAIMLGYMAVLMPIQYFVLTPWQTTLCPPGVSAQYYFQGLNWIHIYYIGCFCFFARYLLCFIQPEHWVRWPESWNNWARLGICLAFYWVFDVASRGLVMLNVPAVAWALSFVILVPIVFDCLPKAPKLLSKVLQKLDFVRFAIFVEHSYLTTRVALNHWPVLRIQRQLETYDVWTCNVYTFELMAVYALLFTPSAFLFRGATRMMDNIWTCFTCDAARRRQLLRHALCWNLPVGVGCVVVASLALTGTLGFTNYPLNKPLDTL